MPTAQHPYWNPVTTAGGNASFMELLTGSEKDGQGLFRIDQSGNVTAQQINNIAPSGDPTGLTDSATIAAAISALPVIPGGPSEYGGVYNGPWTFGRIRLAAGTWTLASTAVIPPTIIFEGAGPGTILQPLAGITALSCHDASAGYTPAEPAQQTMGAIRDLRIDGSLGGAVGLDTGGGWGREIINVAIVNFTAAGAIGLHLNNAANAAAAEWTEKSYMRVSVLNCATCVMIENSAGVAGSDSFEYNDWDFYLAPGQVVAGAAGIVIQGGAYLAGGSLRVRGNFASGGGPVLTVQGRDTASGRYSQIFNTALDIGAESNAVSSVPQTINFGGVNNKITNCEGKLAFQFATWTPSNAAIGQFSFGGPVNGDMALVAANSAPTGWAQAAPPASFTPANPPAYNTNTSTVMMGLNATYIPQSSGNVQVTISFQAWVATAAVPITVGARWGTSAVPTQGAAVTGSRIGGGGDPTTTPAAAGNNAKQMFTFSQVLKGLTPGTQIWADGIYGTSNTADAVNISNPSINFIELS